MAKDLTQLYKFYNIDMIKWQLLVNLIKPMRFMLKVDSWMQSVSGIFLIYFTTFCYFPHFLNSFPHRGNSSLALKCRYILGKPRENSVWTACRYRNSQSHSETWKLTEISSSTFSEGKFPLKMFGVNWMIEICKIRWNSNWKWSWLQSVTNLFINDFHKNMSVARKQI